MQLLSENKVFIFTALGVEYSAVRSHLTDLHPVRHHGSIYEKGFICTQLQTWEVWIAEIGDGNEGAAAVDRALSYAKPGLCLFVGIAAGRKDVKLGDVVASDKVYNYESGRAGIKFLPRPISNSPTEALLSAARYTRTSWAKDNQNPKVFIKPIATGGKLLASTKSPTAKLIEQSYGDSVAVEKEGAGFAYSANACNVPGLVIRGISDMMDDKEESEKDNWQEKASVNAANFAFDLLEAIGPDDQELTHISWEIASPILIKLHRDIENAFKPDVILSTSGPGSCAAFSLQSLNARFVPVLAAVTFPRVEGDLDTLTKFERASPNWIKFITNKWIVFVPEALKNYPVGSRILIFDDRVIGGNTQKAIAQCLSDLGMEVQLAALVSSSEASKDIQYYGRILDGHYEFPWGVKGGRSPNVRGS